MAIGREGGTMKETKKMDGSEKLETVKAVITNRGRALADKAKELTEITKLKAQIMSCEEIIRKNYLEIGRKVYETYEEALSGEEDCEAFHEDSAKEKSIPWESRYKKQCTAIANAQAAIADLEKRIQECKAKER